MRCRVVAKGDHEYPAALEEVPSPPNPLYVRGAELDGGPAVAIVGTRRASTYGLQVAEWLGGQLAGAGLTIVSGLARGIDAAAHRGALDSGGRTVAVLGCGLDVCYPRGNRDLRRRILRSGTLVSEYPSGTPPMPYHFPVRNRIIVGMVLGVVLVEAPPSGGAMITARLAGDYGKELFAVPGPIHSVCSLGPHSMVRQGARLASSADDILCDLGMLHAPSAPAATSGLSPDERRVLQQLEAQPLLLDSLAARTKMPPSTTAAVLVSLEMAGLATRHPGGRYARSVNNPG